MKFSYFSEAFRSTTGKMFFNIKAAVNVFHSRNLYLWDKIFISKQIKWNCLFTTHAEIIKLKVLVFQSQICALYNIFHFQFIIPVALILIFEYDQSQWVSLLILESWYFNIVLFLLLPMKCIQYSEYSACLSLSTWTICCKGLT